jgi:uncharacterized membrane protein
MSTWKYMQNGQPVGPVDTAALLALVGNNTLTPDTLVCKEGTADWIPMRTVSELSGAPASGGSLPPTAPAPSTDNLEVPDPADVEKNKIFAVLAYLGLLFLVPLLAAPQSKFARYHTNQGVVLFLATIIALVGSGILSIIPVVGCVAMVVSLGVCAGSFVLMILGIINAAGGQCKPLPLIGQYKLIK